MATEDVTALRGQLVDRLVADGRIRSAPVEAAFRAVPRHLFLPAVEPATAYRDDAVVTKWEPDGRPISSSSQPAVMAAMLEQLGVEPGHRVLEIGAGTGYNAALLAHLVGPTGAVTTVDLDDDLVERARRQLAAAGFARVAVVSGDGADGWAGAAPYDRIMLTAGARDLAPAWFGQLAPGGRLVLPLALRESQRSVAFDRDGDHLTSVSVVDCGFMPLRGALAGPDPVRLLGPEPGLFVSLDDERAVDTAALYAALRRPGQRVDTGVLATGAEVMGGLRLWLTLREPDVGGLSALGAAADRDLVPALIAYPGMVSTVVLVGERSLAALARPDSTDPGAGPAFDVGVRGFGPAGAELAHRLAAHVRGWQAHGRPSSAGLRIRAYPRGGPAVGPAGGPATFVVDRPHTRLLLDW